MEGAMWALAGAAVGQVAGLVLIYFLADRWRAFRFKRKNL